MATNKHAQVRYKVLDDCLSNFGRLFSFEDLLDECNSKLQDLYGPKYSGIGVRTLRSDLAYLRERAGEFGVEIESRKEGDGYYYRYSEKGFSIFHQDFTASDMAEFREAVLMLQRFKGMPNQEWMSEVVLKIEDKLNLKETNTSVIGYDENPSYSGLDWMEDIFEAIINRQPLKIVYRTFKDKEYIYTIHPHYLKEYNNRWFLFGKYNEDGKVSSLALDRIDSVEQIHIPFVSSDIDYGTYFKDVIGVTVKPYEKQTICLKFSENRFPYILTKAIHSSQRIVDYEQHTIEISVIPNNELDALILSFGKDVQVLYPEEYRNHIREIIQLMVNNFSVCK